MVFRVVHLGEKVVHKDFAVVQDCHPRLDGFVQCQLVFGHANLGQIFREEHVAQVPMAGNQFPYFFRLVAAHNFDVNAVRRFSIICPKTDLFSSL